jgi:hypothetical protein
MNAPSLEQRIASALADTAVASPDLAALIQEVEQAVVSAGTIAIEATARAFDPTVVDPTARSAMQDADFLSRRLRVGWSQLKALHQQVLAQEYRAQWNQRCDEVAAKRNELAAEFAETYPKVVASLIDLFNRIKALDQEVDRVNWRRLIPKCAGWTALRRRCAKVTAR